MKLYIFFLILVLIISGCAKKEIIKETTLPDQNIKTEENLKKVEIITGWTDEDTYTVKVISENNDKGKEKAKHKILQDIVKVRMMNESRFTDITKIKKEFEKPLMNGIIISEEKHKDGVEIYFQIKDQGLRQKFEKK